MTREDIIDHLRSLLSASAHEDASRPRPEGTFLGNASRRGMSGLRVATPDGQVFYLAVLDIDAFESSDAAPPRGSGVDAAAWALLDARDASMLTEEEWEGLARAVQPAPTIPEGAIQRFGYDPAQGLVRVVEAGDRPVLRQSAIPDALAAVAETAESRTGSFFIEGIREGENFQFGREDIEAACEFMVHLGLLAREPDGSYSTRGQDLADKALAAMNALPQA